VFLSYNGADRAAVTRIAERLRQENLEPWLDRWNLTPGERWQHGLVEGLTSSRACAVMVGPSGLGDWAREEMAVAQDRAAKDRGFRLFLVLLPGAPDPFDPSLAFLTTRTWIDLRNGIADPDGIQDLISAITGVARRPPAIVEGAEAVCPYRGLEFFDEGHSEFFYGREDDTQRVIEKLKSSRFLAVLGASGSGKSSMVRAGVVTALRRGVLPGSEGWPVRVFTPGARPLSILAVQLARLFPDEAMHRNLDRMREDDRALDMAISLAMADRPPGERALLVVDQFEEVFTMCFDDHERTAFLDNLLHAATIPGGRVLVVVAMRSDYYQHCASHDQLRALVSSEQFLVGQLSVDELRRVIEEPALAVGLEPEAGLVQTILADVAERPGTLPLLSHVLLELWKARRGRMLTLEAYVANGGVEGALAARANATYESLAPAQQVVARRVLLRLTEPGEGTEDHRRRAPLAELVTDPAEKADVEAVLKALSDERLITVGTDELSGAETADVTHEALIRGWPLLRGWLNEDREALRMHRRLAEAAREWDQGGREEGLLYRGARLALWQDRDVTALNQLERDFLAASWRREERERNAGRRRVRFAVAGLCVALAAISAVAVVAFRAKVEADDRRDLALSRQLAASATAELQADSQRSLLLALRAYEVAPIDEARTALRQATLGSTAKAALQLDDQARTARFSRDGRRVAVASNDGAVRLWDWATESSPVILRGHEGVVRGAAFSPDGQRVVSGGDDGAVRIWDPQRPTEPVVLRGHAGGVISVAYSSDGGRVASGGSDGPVRVWPVTGVAPELVLRGHNGLVYGVAFSEDGQRIVSAGADGSLRIWDLTSGGEARVLRGHVGLVLGAGFSSDGRFVVSAGQDTTVRVWDAATGAPMATLQGHEALVYSASFSPDGQQVVSSSVDGTVRLWDWAGSGAPLVLRGHDGLVFASSFSPDGALVASAGSDGRVLIWDSAGPGQSIVLRRHANRLRHAAFSSDGKRAVTAGEDGLARIWDLSRPDAPIILRGHEGAVNKAVFAPDGRVLTVGVDSTVRVWDPAHRTDSVILPGRVISAFGAAFSPDGRLVVAGGVDQVLRVWDLAVGGEPTVLQGNTGAVLGTSFSPDGRRVASASVDGTVRIWNLDQPQSAPVVLTGHRGIVDSVAFSPDGRRVVSAGGDGAVRIWDASGQGRPVVLTGHHGFVLHAVFAPDGRVLSGGTDGTVRIWDPSGRDAPIVLQRLEDSPVSWIDFSADGRKVVVAANDGTATVWNCEVCGSVRDVLTLARSRVVRQLTPDERAAYLNERR
jgi:WD40 repeat protein/ABC-type Fe3+/spermidine/putrescine transport system ATPase subunit